jgi:hypothetical protein
MPVLFPSALRAIATYNKDFAAPMWRSVKGVRVDINLTAVGSGASRLDVKLQYRDASEGAWEDLTGGSIVQLATTGEIDLTVYPGLTAVANRLVTQVPLPKALRCVATVSGDTATFNIGAEFLD